MMNNKMNLMSYFDVIYTLRHKSSSSSSGRIIIIMSSYDHFVVLLLSEGMELLVIHRIHIVYTLIILVGSCVTYAYINNSNTSNNKKTEQQKKNIRQQYQHQVDDIKQKCKEIVRKQSEINDVALNELRETMILENGCLKLRLTELEEENKGLTEKNIGLEEDNKWLEKNYKESQKIFDIGNEDFRKKYAMYHSMLQWHTKSV
jgi:hypothetical protein